MKYSTPLGKALTAGLLSFSAIAFSPAQAQTAPACATSGLGGSGAFTISLLVGLGETGCQIGDKVYSNFSFSENWSSSGIFGFTNSTDTEHTFSGSALALGVSETPYTYSYTVTPLDPNQWIDSYRTDLGTSFTGSTVATKELGNDQSADDSIASLPGASPGNVVNLPVDSSVPVVFDSSLTVTTGRIDVITDSLVQAPGPLPILGAGAGFAFSRKLRRRIKASA